MLRYCYEYEIGIKSNREKTFELYKKSADQGFSIAKLEVAFSLIHGIGIQRNPFLGFKIFENFAINAEPKAQLSLATCYMIGIGTPKDKIKGLKLCRKSADESNRSVCAFTKSAELGAQLDFSVSADPLKKVTNVNKDEEKAFLCFQSAAKFGFPDAQARLGRCYIEGTGTLTDHAKAFKWFQRSAEGGNDYAQCCLGHCYSAGKGVDVDYTKAYHWFQKSAQQQNNYLCFHFTW
ncbi:10606_t:CDS:2 [Ambispora leptoticha]|uniref:10606_t:CDS:1 n=1 Tax=Ambispora leptoticha TaxID=144679 RepID=A0A9N8VZB1_9GLOM|nr:10606_t:CDS:2 [Ambispora leptoticha]